MSDATKLTKENIIDFLNEENIDYNEDRLESDIKEALENVNIKILRTAVSNCFFDWIIKHYKQILASINRDLLIEKIFNKFINRFIKPIFYNIETKSNYYEIWNHTFDCSKNNQSLFIFLVYLIFIIKERNNDANKDVDKIQTDHYQFFWQLFIDKQSIINPIVDKYLCEDYLERVKTKHQFKRLTDLLQTVPNFLIFFFNYIRSMCIRGFGKNWLKDINKLNEALKVIDSEKLKLTTNNSKKTYSLNELKIKGEQYIKNNLISEYDSIDRKTILFILNYISDNLFHDVLIYYRKDDTPNLFKCVFNVFVGYMILIISEDKLKKLIHEFENTNNIKLNDSIQEISNKLNYLNDDDPIIKSMFDFFGIDIKDKNLNININPDLLLQYDEYKNLDFDDSELKVNAYIQKHKDKFKQLIKDFLNKYYKDKFNEDNLNYFCEHLTTSLGNIVKRLICVIIDNFDYFGKLKTKIDQFWYFVIYIYEINSENTRGFVFAEKNKLNNEELDFNAFINRKSIINDCYDSQALTKVINDNLADVFKELDFSKIDLICLVDNNLLSIKSRLAFANKERLGDMLYKVIIYDLIINAQIKDLMSFDDYFAAKFQEQLIKSIKWAQLIQTNKLHFGKTIAYSDADYFEALLYEIYRLNGYIKTKEFILKLFQLNKASYLFKPTKHFEEEKAFYEKLIDFIPKEINYTIPSFRYMNYLKDENKDKQFDDLIGRYIVNFAAFFNLEKAIINEDIKQLRISKFQNNLFNLPDYLHNKNEKQWLYRYLYNISQCDFATFKKVLISINEYNNAQYWTKV